MPVISVIIPTYRRPKMVEHAVRSILEQTYRPFEVLVVIDGTDDGTRAVIDALDDPRTRVIETGVNRGPAEARNHGVRHAAGQYITMLDDDDEWIKTKLERQMQFVRQHGLEGSEFLLSCRTLGKHYEAGTIHTWPKRLYKAGTPISDYLLDRRMPFSRPGFIGSGSLLFPRTLALRVPFPDDEVHEDWSWLLLCVGREQVPLLMCEEPLFVYNIRQTPSRNNLMKWRRSLEWGRKYRPYMTGRALAGLLSSTTAWRAKSQDGLKAFPELARAMLKEANPTLMHWLMLSVVMTFPLGIAEKLRQQSF